MPFSRFPQADKLTTLPHIHKIQLVLQYLYSKSLTRFSRTANQVHSQRFLNTILPTPFKYIVYIVDTYVMEQSHKFEYKFN